MLDTLTCFHPVYDDSKYCPVQIIVIWILVVALVYVFVLFVKFMQSFPMLNNFPCEHLKDGSISFVFPE